jgi:hypothetical protein
MDKHIKHKLINTNFLIALFITFNNLPESTLRIITIYNSILGNATP